VMATSFDWTAGTTKAIRRSERHSLFRNGQRQKAA
jgi:hypothetical protein